MLPLAPTKTHTTGVTQIGRPGTATGGKSRVARVIGLGLKEPLRKSPCNVRSAYSPIEAVAVREFTAGCSPRNPVPIMSMPKFRPEQTSTVPFTVNPGIAVIWMEIGRAHV